MKLFRVVLRRYGATPRDAFSGLSGYSADGRWHRRGRYLDYASASRSLATLERLVHYKRFDALEPHVIYTLEIPDASIETGITAPAGWDGVDLLPAAQNVGDAWCDTVRSPVLQVFSATTLGEHNFLVNTRHPSWDWNWVKGPNPFGFDTRLVEMMEKAKRAR